MLLFTGSGYYSVVEEVARQLHTVRIIHQNGFSENCALYIYKLLTPIPTITETSSIVPGTLNYPYSLVTMPAIHSLLEVL